MSLVSDGKEVCWCCAVVLSAETPPPAPPRVGEGSQKLEARDAGARHECGVVCGASDSGDSDDVSGVWEDADDADVGGGVGWRGLARKRGKTARSGSTRSRRCSASRLSARPLSRSLKETMPTSLRGLSRSTTGKRVSPVAATR